MLKISHIKLNLFVKGFSLIELVVIIVVSIRAMIMEIIGLSWKRVYLMGKKWEEAV